MIARVVNVFVVTWITRPCKGKDKWRVNTYELQVIYASGLVKGAVPFALITSTVALSATASKTTSLIIRCTVIALVFFTSIIINAVLPVFIRNRLRKSK